MKRIVQCCKHDEFRARTVFIEDYDLTVARYMLQGVDVWLNTPRRGMEASGTSGMKVLPNGGLNLSILDGWWCEAFAPEVGWAIGQGEEYEDFAYQDAIESSALYDLLEKEVVPLFWTRTADGTPREWIQRMKRSMKRLSPVFSTNRMLGEYAARHYLPIATLHERLSADGFARARALAAWNARVQREWAGVGVDQLTLFDGCTHQVGDSVPIVCVVRLGDLAPADVAVEASVGLVGASREIDCAVIVPLRHGEALGGGRHRYAGAVPCTRSGQQGYTVRVRPHHDDASNLFLTGLMSWA